MSPDIVTALLVSLGGGLGAIARYAADVWISRSLHRRNPRAASYPWGIVVVNLSGSLALGILLGLGIGSPALTVGVLGGYTTFSTASLDTLRLFRERRYGATLVHSFGALGGAVLCAYAGIAIGGAFG